VENSVPGSPDSQKKKIGGEGTREENSRFGVGSLQKKEGKRGGRSPSTVPAKGRCFGVSRAPHERNALQQKEKKSKDGKKKNLNLPSFRGCGKVGGEKTSRGTSREAAVGE